MGKTATRRYLMSWIPKRKEWQKMHKGIRYRMTATALGCPPTKDGSAQAANDWWKMKEAELLMQQPNMMAWDRVIQVNQMMGNWFNMVGDPKATQHIQNRLEELYARKSPVTSPDEIDDPLWGQSQSGRAVWKDRFKSASNVEEKTETNRRISYHVRIFKQDKIREQQTGKISVGRCGAYCGRIDYFEKWIGGKKSIDALTAAKMDEYLAHIQDQQILRKKNSKQKKGMADWTAKASIDVAKQFLDYLDGIDLIKTPKNVTKRRYTISVDNPAPQPAKDDDVKKLVNGPDCLGKCCAFLMLNCGFQQSQIAGLTQDDIDWEKGTITHLRGKTKKFKGVPTVTYKLWPKTLELLTQFGNKSGLLITNSKGGPIWRQWIRDDGKKGLYDGVRKVLREKYMADVGVDIPMNIFRKTSAQKLEKHKDHKHFIEYFLAHSASSVKRRSYSTEDQDQFDEAVEWLGRELGVIK